MGAVERVANTPEVRSVADVLERDIKPQIAEALPPGVSLERFMRTAKTAIQTNPDIAMHDQKSLYLSLVKCAGDGLLPDGREAAMAVYGGKVQYMPMIGGLRKRAAEHGITIDAHVVYEHDEFGYELGLEPKITHRPPRLGEERGQPIGAYAVATDREGRKTVSLMSKAEIEKRRKVSRARSGPWQEWWEEMAAKTVGRHVFKKLPLFDEATARLIEHLDADVELRTPEQDIDAALGHVGPPRDTAGPDDTIDASDDDVVEEPDEGSAGEPQAAKADDADQQPRVPVSQAAATAGEPASPADATEGEGEQTSFAALAEEAQQRRRARQGGAS